MKWLSYLVLLAVLAVAGCSSKPAGTAGDANDPALTTDSATVDEASERDMVAPQ